MKRSPNYGQLVPLTDYDHEWPVYGHCTDEEALAAVREWAEDHDEELPERLGVTCRIWARWGFSGEEDFDREFYTHREKSRGAFPITIVSDLTRYEKNKARQAKEAAFKAAIQAWLPEATDLWVYQDATGASFRLPEVGRVELKADGKVYLQADKVEAWKRLYQGRDNAPEVPK